MPKLSDKQIMARAERLGMSLPVHGKIRSLGDAITMDARLSQITEREKILSLKSRSQRSVTFKVRLPLYERLLAMAEKWEEDLPVVQRACLIYGLDHYEQWAASESTPFAAGELRIRTNAPSQSDPTGIRFAQGQVIEPPFQRPILRQFRPVQPMEQITETSEPVFSREQLVDSKGRQVPLPSGATENGQVHEPQALRIGMGETVPEQARVPQDEVAEQEPEVQPNPEPQVETPAPETKNEAPVSE